MNYYESFIIIMHDFILQQDLQHIINNYIRKFKEFIRIQLGMTGFIKHYNMSY